MGGSDGPNPPPPPALGPFRLPRNPLRPRHHRRPPQMYTGRAPTAKGPRHIHSPSALHVAFGRDEVVGTHGPDGRPRPPLGPWRVVSCVWHEHKMGEGGGGGCTTAPAQCPRGPRHTSSVVDGVEDGGALAGVGADAAHGALPPRPQGPQVLCGCTTPRRWGGWHRRRGWARGRAGARPVPRESADMYVYARVSVCMCTCIPIRMHVYVHTYTYACVRAYLYATYT